MNNNSKSYTCLCNILKPLFYILYHPKIKGCNNIPEYGSAVMASNHISILDPVLLARSTKRQIKYVAKSELYKNKLSAYILKSLHTIPIHRTRVNEKNIELTKEEIRENITSFRAMYNYLKKGQIIGIFPEGTRLKDETKELGDFESGVSNLGKKAPVVPCAIKGKYKLFRSNVTLNIGTPMYNASTEEIRDKILSLKRSK